VRGASLLAPARLVSVPPYGIRVSNIGFEFCARHMADLESLAGESGILFLCAAGKPKGIGVPG